MTLTICFDKVLGGAWNFTLIELSSTHEKHFLELVVAVIAWIRRTWQVCII